jgi:hypothetical protein
MGLLYDEGENSESLKIEAYHEKSVFPLSWTLVGYFGFTEYWSCD